MKLTLLALLPLLAVTAPLAMARAESLTSTVPAAQVPQAGLGTFAHGRTPASLPPPQQNIFEILSHTREAAKFVELVNAADLKDLLATTPDQSITVFVPTNEALDNLTGDARKHVEASKASLQIFVEYHIVQGAIVSLSALRGRKSAPVAVSGEAINVDGTDLKSAPKINDGAVVGNDITATNGVIHLISTPLVPPSQQAVTQALIAGALPPVAPKAPVVPKAAIPPRPLTVTTSLAAKSSSVNGSLTGPTALNATSSTDTGVVSTIAHKLGF